MPDALRSVLVVDDDEDVRESVALALRDEGYDVRTAANGKEALESLDHAPRPGLMLLDLMMPVMNGWATLDALKERQHAPPVVVVSAAVPPVPPGVAGCLRKPIDLDTLLDKVSATFAA